MRIIRNNLMRAGTPREARVRLLLALGLVAAAQGALLSTAPLLMATLAIDAGRLGVAVAAGLLATMALAPVAGMAADRLGPHVTARSGSAAIFAASALLCGYAAMALDGAAGATATFAVILATRLANGAGVAVLHPSAQAWASAIQNTGRVAGPVGVAVVGGWGAAWTLAALAAVSASALLLLVLTPGPSLVPGAAAPASRVARQPGAPDAALKREAWLLLAALFSLHVLAGGAQFLLGPLLMARLDFGASEAARWAGWLTALAAVATVAGSFLAQALQRGQRPLAGAGVATAGALALAPFANFEAVAAGVALLATGIGAAVPSAMAELMRRSPSQKRGRAAGRAAALQAAAFAASISGCGLIFSASPALAAALLPLPAAAACLVLILAAAMAPACPLQPDAAPTARKR